MKLRLNAVLCASILFLLSCTKTSVVSQGGGGSEVEVVGYAYISGGDPAPLTEVKLIPDDYDPSSMDAIPDSMIDTTDSLGRYAFHTIAEGRYNIQAVQTIERTRLLLTGLDVSGDTAHVESGTLRIPGAIRILLEDSTRQDGYLTVPGTDISTFVSAGETEIVLDSVPAGLIAEIRYRVGDSVVTIREDVLVYSSDTITLNYSSWEHFQKIFLNTTASGAGVESDVYAFPVLIRLTDENFDFSQARNGGEDIRFTKPDGTALAYEIESWDASSRQAAIWVLADTVYGNDSTQSMTMYWGNPGAGNMSNSAAVFNTTAGFQGVWHLGEAADSVYDATDNLYHGGSPDTACPQVAPGMIGNSRLFDGTDDFITMPNTADGALNFAQDGNYTISAWVCLDTFDGVSHCIVSKGYEQYYLRSTYISTNLPPVTTPLWEFVQFADSEGIGTWQTTTGTVSQKQWSLLVGVRRGDRQLLYCDGELVDSLVDVWQNEAVSRNNTNDLLVGRFAQAVTIPIDEGFCYFRGRIDELRVMSESVDSDWVRLCYRNQNPDDRLVVFKK